MSHFHVQGAGLGLRRSLLADIVNNPPAQTVDFFEVAPENWTIGGRRYPLVIYTRMMDRWWPAIFAIGVTLLAMAWLTRWWGFEEWRWTAIAGVGGLNAFIGILLLILRESAYVQPFSDHMRLATPFLRLNISYKRFRRASSANMGALFPPGSISS